MADLQNGKLIFKGEGKNRKRHLVFTTKKGGTWDQPINPGLLSDSLRSNQEAEVEVQFELDASGRPTCIRPVGEEWKATEPSAAPGLSPGTARASQPRREGRRDARWGEKRGERRPQFQTERHSQTLTRDFHNPYNFIPAPPRDHIDGSKNDLGDHKPAGHDSYKDDLWSGRIAVKLTTQTPLLVLDAGKAKPFEKVPDHKIFPTRIGADGQPYLPPTSIKGMLRSAFEAITNSRLAVFEKHQDRLAYRMPAQRTDDRKGPFPARVEERNGRLGLRLMVQTNLLGSAARLPRYQDGRQLPKDKGESYTALRYPDGDLPRHGDPVWVSLDKSTVLSIQLRTSLEQPTSNLRPGWVCVTGPNINRKRFERVFIESPDDLFIPITSEHEKLWRELIQNYKDTHERDLEKRKKRGKPQDWLGHVPGDTGWSRHIYEPDSEKLREGTLCYVEFVSPDSDEVQALLPVTISRRLFEASPDSLQHDSLKPASSRDQLSPADRVFGWVNQDGAGAYRGHLSVGPVRCASPNSLLTFGGNGLPLAILGQPKPQQARFYAARSKQGEAQENGYRKERGYIPEKGLRGRKVYPHHADLPQGYWDNPMEDRTQQSNQGFFQEYRRPHKLDAKNGKPQFVENGKAFKLKSGEENEQRDDQNRSITSWVRPLTVFEFQIDVTNLSGVELGALLWLLSLPDDHCHRLGGAKPLGFGSVRLEIEWNKTDLRTGALWQKAYLTLDETENPNAADAQARIQEFRQAVESVYGSGRFEQVPFIAAFTRCARGFTKPVHYPRALQEGQQHNSTIPPHPEGKAYEWFVENERMRGDRPLYGLALSDLASDDGLPIL
jgi:CRISPR-associated protein (TIGR03986 family)